MKVVEALADAVSLEGVDVAFNVPDEVTVFLAQALHERSVRIVRPRHEQNAVFMADGFARATGRVGVCAIGPGPAIAQVGTGVVTAQRRRSPVLVLLGQAPRERGTVKEFDARRFAEALGVSYAEVRSPATLVEDVREAFRRVRLHRAPVILGCGDLHTLSAEFPGPFEYRPRSTDGQQNGNGIGFDPSSEAIQEAAALLSRAERPVIIAGRGAATGAARQTIIAVGERVGALLATSVQARELFRGHPQNIGIIGSLGSEGTAELLSESDCVYAVGLALNVYQSKAVPAHAKIIHVNTDADRIGEFTPVDVGIVGDAAAVSHAIEQSLSSAQAATNGGWSQTSQARIEATSEKAPPLPWPAPGDGTPEGRLPLREALGAIDRTLPADRYVVVDAGLFLPFVVDQISVPNPDSWAWTMDFGSMGLGLSVGIGVALGSPDRHCVVITGDGGFMMNMQELETAVRERVPITLVILNNASYGAEARFLQQGDKPIDLAVYSDVDFAAVARSFGGAGLTITSSADLAGAAEEIAGRTATLLLDVKVKEDELSRMNESLSQPASDAATARV